MPLIDETEAAAADFLQDFQNPPRYGELSKLLPVAAVVATIIFMYWEYVYLHCFRLLQFDLPAESRQADDVARGCHELWIFHAITGMMVYCLVKCILTNPGSIPDGRGWELGAEGEDANPEAGGQRGPPTLLETKNSGERRHCKWCLKYKPDRCHHCRICNTCVLRMDHHCPWVYNCIGFRNHKYFFLLIVYAALDLIVINLTMFDSVWWSTRIDVSILTMFALIGGETLATFLMVMTCAFLAFHVWLMSKAMTTVEFCEKSLKKASYNSSVYSQGAFQNVCAILGPEPLLWFVPVSFPSGDGLTWKSEPATGSSTNNRRESRRSSGNAQAGARTSQGPAAW